MLTGRNRAVTPHVLRGPGFQSQAFIRNSWIPEQVRDDDPFLSLRPLDRRCIPVSELSDFYGNDGAWVVVHLTSGEKPASVFLP